MKKIKIITLVLILFGMYACEMPDNINPKRPSTVPPSYLFVNAERALGDDLFSPNVNGNISLLLCQHFAQTTYYSESRYAFMDRNIPDGYWNTTYRDVLMDLITAKKNLEEIEGMVQTEKDNQLAALDVLIVYAYQTLVDAFGNVPYSEACMGAENPTPKYDDAKTIYVDLINRLTADISAFNVASTTFTATTDIICGGSTAKWKAFAASLKLRLGMRLADCDNTLARSTVEAAAPDVIASPENNVFLQYTGSSPYYHPWYTEFKVNGRRTNWMPPVIIIETMKGLADPRISKFFTTATLGDSVGKYNGAIYGTLNAASGIFSSFAQSVNTWAPNAQSVFIDQAEVEFLLAEAAERGYTINGTAEEHYDDAITASLTYWGCTSTEIEDYLANTKVAYTTAAGTYKQKIGTQKWLALFGRGVEAWAEWRRLDFPVLSVPPLMTYDDIPVRMPYPFQEDSYNLENYTAAVEAMGGTDAANVKLFWDVN